MRGAVGACGALALLSDHHVTPNAQTIKRRQMFVDAAEAFGGPPALVFGLVPASTALVTALGQNKTAFANGGSQVWMFKRMGSDDVVAATSAHNVTAKSGDVGTTEQGWIGSLFSSVRSLVGIGGEDIVADAARSRLYLQGHPLHDNLLQSAASLQTAVFGMCDAALLADSDGMQHPLPAVRATNEMQQSLMQLTVSQAKRLVATQGAAINPVSGERWTMLEAAVMHAQLKRVNQYLKLEPNLCNHQGRLRQPVLHIAILLCRDGGTDFPTSARQDVINTILRSPSIDIELRDRWNHSAGMIALKLCAMQLLLVHVWANLLFNIGV
eukprot:COSAG02_NODE_138_length_34440_cov_16.694368_6_plen_326_part_00